MMNTKPFEKSSHSEVSPNGFISLPMKCLLDLPIVFTNEVLVICET